MAVGDKLLKFDHSIIPQETFYWCGPATMQVLLNIRGKNVSEQKMARELGTTTNGTDYIGLLTGRLNDWLGAGSYVSVSAPDGVGKSALKEATDTFFEDVAAGVEAGYGTAVNIMVPPTNYPRPSRGETAAYGGGWVYHYFSLVGVNRGTREIAVADSGFREFFYWIKVDQLYTMIQGKGYSAPRGVAQDSLPVDEITEFIRAYFGPLISDVKDLREQFCGQGSRDAGKYTGWPQLGSPPKTLVDGVADLKDTVEAR